MVVTVSTTFEHDIGDLLSCIADVFEIVQNNVLIYTAWGLLMLAAQLRAAKDQHHHVKVQIISNAHPLAAQFTSRRKRDLENR